MNEFVKFYVSDHIIVNRPEMLDDIHQLTSINWNVFLLRNLRNQSLTSYDRDQVALAPPIESRYQINDRVRSKTASDPNTIYRIRGWDRRNRFLLVPADSLFAGSAKWHHSDNLIPENYLGDTYLLPGDQVQVTDPTHSLFSEKKKYFFIQDTKTTSMNYSQILLIDGIWVPSSCVERVGGWGDLRISIK